VRPKGVADGHLVNIPELLLVSMRGRRSDLSEAMVSVGR
jgi:sulfopyruvate decarboxylase TPP-binding subunit